MRTDLDAYLRSNVDMPASKKCPQCGAPMRSDAPDGACLRCAFESALQAGLQQPKQLGPSASDAGSGRRKILYFGDYEVLEKIGEGGMGIIYRARQTSLGRIVAIKVIKGEEIASPGLLARFIRET